MPKEFQGAIKINQKGQLEACINMNTEIRKKQPTTLKKILLS